MNFSSLGVKVGSHVGRAEQQDEAWCGLRWWVGKPPPPMALALSQLAAFNLITLTKPSPQTPLGLELTDGGALSIWASSILKSSVKVIRVGVVVSSVDTQVTPFFQIYPYS